MNFDVYVRVFCHLIFVYSFEFVFSCQPWGYIIHNDAMLYTVLHVFYVTYWSSHAYICHELLFGLGETT